MVVAANWAQAFFNYLKMFSPSNKKDGYMQKRGINKIQNKPLLLRKSLISLEISFYAHIVIHSKAILCKFTHENECEVIFTESFN